MTPLFNLHGGCKTVPPEMTVYFPILIAVVDGDFSLLSLGENRWRSPRRQTSPIMTDRPARMMFALPSIRALREILLPVSFYSFNCQY